MALPLLEEGRVGSLLLENPFYGSRKPKEQVRSQLHHVSDLLVMGLALILECHLLLHWLEKGGLGPIGLTGISMGGHNASLAAALCPKPIPVVPCLSWATASCVFTKGVLSSAVCWEVLERQLSSDDDGGLRELFHGVVCETTGKTSTHTLHQRDHGDELCHVVKGGPDLALLSPPPPSSLPPPSLLPPPSPPESKQSKKFIPAASTVLTMEALLDYSTHLRYFPVPLAPDLAMFLVAKDDLYVPRDNITDVRIIWPGCCVKYIEGGHVLSCIAKQPHFRNALYSVLDKMAVNPVMHTT